MIALQTKICYKCGEKKKIENFCKNKRAKDGYNIWCKQCSKEYKKKYNLEHKEELKEKRALKSEEHKTYCREWHQKNKEREKEYRKKMRNKKKENDKLWYEQNIDKMREYHKQYKRKTRTDELIYAKDRIRNMISLSFRRKKYTKKSKTYQILGEKYEIVWEYLKETWYKNYGKEYNGESYEIDHMIPLATAKTEEDVIKLCHYTNLQLLTPEDNLKKGKSAI